MTDEPADGATGDGPPDPEPDADPDPDPDAGDDGADPPIADASVAVLHDRFPTMGGGEAFAVEVARVLDAPIYTAYVASDVDLPRDVRVIPFRQSKYVTGPTSRLLEWKSGGMNPLEPPSVAFDMTDAHAALPEYDVVFESGTLSKSYVPTSEQTVVHYPHSPPRWLYDRFRDRMAGFDYPGVGFALRAYAKLWRALDKEANDYVDRFVANSELVRRRIRRYYDEDAAVVYPPITGDWRTEGDEGYFVTWSRLTPAKRVDLLVEAFAGLDERLVVAGDGEERPALERLAAGHDNVEIRGYVDDVESLVAGATAVVYAPTAEDFGMVGAEALTAGKPLLGVDEGFTRHQIEEGVTGHLFEPTVESVRETVRAFDPDAFDAAEIRERAEKYRYDAFESGVRRVVREALAARGAEE
jgi:glycosyltransferase involved in cell wall biosynthesis